MKQYLLLSFNILFLFSALGFSQKIISANHPDLPEEKIMNTLSKHPGENVHQKVFKDPFEPDDYLIEETIYQTWDVLSWESVYRYTYLYTPDGLRQAYITYQWDGTIWANYTKTEYVYNENNQVLEISFYDWNGSEWIDESKSEYEYD